MAKNKPRYTDAELMEMATDAEAQWLYRMSAETVLQMREINRKLDHLIAALPEC
jgi:hypothetical protein